MYYLTDGERAALVGWLIGGYSFLSYFLFVSRPSLSIYIYIINGLPQTTSEAMLLWSLSGDRNNFIMLGKKIINKFIGIFTRTEKKKKKQVSLGVNFKLTN